MNLRLIQRDNIPNILGVEYGMRSCFCSRLSILNHSVLLKCFLRGQEIIPGINLKYATTLLPSKLCTRGNLDQPYSKSKQFIIMFEVPEGMAYSLVLHQKLLPLHTYHQRKVGFQPARLIVVKLDYSQG